MTGVLLQNESLGRIQGAPALAPWGSPHSDLKQAYLGWEVGKKGRKEQEFPLVLPIQFLVFQKQQASEKATLENILQAAI